MKEEEILYTNVRFGAVYGETELWIACDRSNIWLIA